MRNGRLEIFLLISGFLVLILSGGQSVRAEAPTNVGLRYFLAAPQEDGIRLEWATETELGTAGFNVERSLGTSNNFVILDNIGFVAAEGTISTGATYSRVDDTAVYGETYTYKLVEIETNANRVDLETVTVTYLLSPTETPNVINESTPTTTPTQTPVPTSTSPNPGTPASTAAATSAVTASPATVTATPATNPSPTSAAPDTTNQNPTATNAANPDIPLESSSPESGVVLAQETETSPYPAPTTAVPIPGGEITPADQTPIPTAYPPGFTNATPTVVIIGNQTESTRLSEAAPSPSPANEAAPGRIFLWIGFIVSLLIFITGISGAIVLYRRKWE